MDQSNNGHSVAVLGFSSTERIVLESIFRLAARRQPKYVQYQTNSGTSPAIFLVDATPVALQQLRAVNANNQVPVILVGDSNMGTPYPVMPRPLQWSRLFKLLDDAVMQAQAKAATHPGLAVADAVDSVLVVDDSLPVRRFMASKLAPFGVHVDFAESGEQAIGLSAAKFYKVVFLDVIMGGIDGYQVCKVIKVKRKDGKSPAVVMLTSKGSPFDKIRGAMAGCDAYLTKPVEEEKLLTTIAKYLEVPVAAGSSRVLVG